MRSLIRDLSRSVFFLDYDGTLCPHLEVWEQLLYDPQEIWMALQNLSKKAAGIWWNTGRRVESLRGVNPNFLLFPGFFIQGSIFWNAHRTEVEVIGNHLPEDLRRELEVKLSTEEAHARLEIKPTAARIASLRKTQRKHLQRYVESLQIKLSSGWEWRIGDRGAELLHEKFSKGSALQFAYDQKLVSEDSIPVVAGDDHFDRPAMEFALERGGYALLVGEGCGWVTEIPHRASQVIYFREPRDFLHFLRTL